jgi:hypothetical protein
MTDIYERLPETSVNLIHAAISCIILWRLARMTSEGTRV